MKTELHAVDVNLLVVLDVLLQELSISRTAERLSCGQPAISKKLAALRSVFRDELLVRQGKNMFPTPRAAQLAQPLSEALRSLNRCIEPPERFDPATARGLIRMGLRYTGVTILPELLQRLRSLAPGLDIHALDMRDDAQSPLARGDLDLVLQPGVGSVTSISRGQVRRLPQYLYAQRLYSAEWVCVVSKNHPSIKKTLTLERYSQTPHILISLRGDAYGFVDAGLEEVGKRRRVALMVQNFTEAFMHASTTDFVLTSHLDVALSMRELFPVKLYKPPIKLDTVHLSQVWHERTAQDPMHRWLRKAVYDIGRKLDARYATETRRLRL